MYKKIFGVFLVIAGNVRGMFVAPMAKAFNAVNKTGIYQAARFISSSQLKKEIVRQDKAIAQQRDALCKSIEKCKKDIQKGLAREYQVLRLTLLEEQMRMLKLQQLQLKEENLFSLEEAYNAEIADLEQKIREIVITKPTSRE